MSFLWSFGTKKEPVVPNVLPQTPQQSFKAMSNTFRKGVQYNMKVILRGDVMTGKTNLFHRLQGSDFNADYTSTPQIEVANIPWHYKDSNDIVKIEVWDVVDKAHNKAKSNENQGIKLEHRTTSETETTKQQPAQEQQQQQQEADLSMGLDASTVNVYRNTHCAIFIFDVTKPWTFDYVNKELVNVPESMSVLVLGNFVDKVQERKVELEKIHAALYEHNQERIQKGSIKPNLIRYVETSMQSGLGLKFIYDYLGVPFLQLMIESLHKQLELKAVEIVDLLETLDTNEDVPEILQRRRGQDNFDQPSEPRLAQQHEEMKSAWDQELEAIAADHPSMLEEPVFFERQETPPVLTSPVKSKKKNNVQLEPEPVPPIVNEYFSTGDEINDDWFGEQDSTPVKLPTYKNESDEEGPGNPMVLGDEDVEPIFYDNKPIEHHKEDTEGEEEEEEGHDHDKKEESTADTYHPPVFKSELNEVWSRGLRRLSGPEVISDSDDEDNAPSFAPYDNRSSPFMESYQGYEEIGGSNDNPWSNEQDNDKKHIAEDAQTQNDIQTEEVQVKAEEEEEEEAPKETKKKKSSKKKSKSSKKKKSTS